MATARSSMYSFKRIPLRMFFTSYAGDKWNSTPCTDSIGNIFLSHAGIFRSARPRRLLNQIAPHSFQQLRRLFKAAADFKEMHALLRLKKCINLHLSALYAFAVLHSRPASFPATRRSKSASIQGCSLVRYIMLERLTLSPVSSMKRLATYSSGSLP